MASPHHTSSDGPHPLHHRLTGGCGGSSDWVSKDWGRPLSGWWCVDYSRKNEYCEGLPYSRSSRRRQDGGGGWLHHPFSRAIVLLAAVIIIVVVIVVVIIIIVVIIMVIVVIIVVITFYYVHYMYELWTTALSLTLDNIFSLYVVSSFSTYTCYVFTLRESETEAGVKALEAFSFRLP